jgi:chitin disaccharide deacetylase
VKYLIVNADDFGMTDGINAGVIEAHKRGVVTSASLMVKQPKAGEAARLAAALPKLSLGLHIDLAEWEPVGGVWRQIYARVDVEDPTQVAGEIAEQLDTFVKLVGHEPDHIDSHQHVHMDGTVRDAALQLARRLDVPVRGLDARVTFCGEFYGHQRRAELYPEGVTAANLLRLSGAIADGWTELMCHPGYACDVRSVYAREREVELGVLCQPDLPAALRAIHVELRSFADLLLLN